MTLTRTIPTGYWW